MSRLHFGAFRPLTIVLALLLVPILVVGGPARPAAAAVVAVGPTVTGYATSDDLFPGEAVSCSVTGYTRLHDSGLYSVRATVRCDFGFGREDFDNGRLIARDATGGDCLFEAASFAITENSDTETTLTANLHPETPPEADCNLTTGELTLSVTYQGTFNRDPVTMEFAWGLGALPVATSPPGSDFECGSYYYKAPVVSEPYAWSTLNGGVTRWFLVFDVTFYAMHKPGTSRQGGGYYNNGPYAYMVLSGTGAGENWSGTNNSGINHGYNFDSVPSPWVTQGTSGWYYHPSAHSFGNSITSGNTYSAVRQRIGLTRYQSSGAGYATEAEALASEPQYELHGVGIQHAASGTSSIQYGRTNVANCSVYWGEAIRTDADAAPWSPLNVPWESGPPVEEPTDLPAGDPINSDDGSCSGFSFTDPSSWAGAGICVLVKAVKALYGAVSKLASAVAGIPAAILSGLADLFGDLFVPDLDLLKANFEDVQDAYADTYPGAWVEAVGDFQVPASAASGCAGPSVDVPLGEGINFEAEPLNACDGQAAQLASLCKLILTVSIGFFGGLACVRAIGSGFNWSPGGTGAA